MAKTVCHCPRYTVLFDKYCNFTYGNLGQCPLKDDALKPKGIIFRRSWKFETFQYFFDCMALNNINAHLWWIVTCTKNIKNTKKLFSNPLRRVEELPLYLCNPLASLLYGKLWIFLTITSGKSQRHNQIHHEQRSAIVLSATHKPNFIASSPIKFMYQCLILHEDNFVITSWECTTKTPADHVTLSWTMYKV